MMENENLRFKTLVIFVAFQAICIVTLGVMFFKNFGLNEKVGVVQQHVSRKVETLLEQAIDNCTRFFATTPDGRVIPLVSLSEPMVHSNRMQSWIGQSLTNILSFGFNDYQQHFTRNRSYFTDQGWIEFQRELKRERLVETVKTQKIFIKSSPATPAILIEEGDKNGIYRWIYEVPMVMTYANDKAIKSSQKKVRLVVERVSVKHNINGFALAGWAFSSDE